MRARVRVRVRLGVRGSLPPHRHSVPSSQGSAQPLRRKLHERDSSGAARLVRVRVRVRVRGRARARARARARFERRGSGAGAMRHRVSA